MSMIREMRQNTKICIGLCYILLRMLRLGSVTVVHSHAAASGFTSGAVILIATTQLKDIVGAVIPSDPNLRHMLVHLWTTVDQWNWPSLGLGCSSVSLLGLALCETIVKQ